MNPDLKTKIAEALTIIARCELDMDDPECLGAFEALELIRLTLRDDP